MANTKRGPITDLEFMSALTDTIPVETIDLKDNNCFKEERGRYNYDIMIRGDDYGDLYIITVRSVKSKAALEKAFANPQMVWHLSQEFTKWWNAAQQKDVFIKKHV